MNTCNPQTLSSTGRSSALRRSSTALLWNAMSTVELMEQRMLFSSTASLLALEYQRFVENDPRWSAAVIKNVCTRMGDSWLTALRLSLEHSGRAGRNPNVKHHTGKKTVGSTGPSSTTTPTPSGTTPGSTTSGTTSASQGEGGTTKIPAAPSALAAEGISYDEIDLSWTNNAVNQNGFHIERSSDGTNYQVIGTTTGTTYDDKQAGLTPGDTYYYKVAAYNDGGTSSYTAGVAATFILPNLPAYSAPSSNPGLPSGSDTFLPPVGDQTLSSGVPAIAASNLDAGPDDTVTLTGAALTDNAASNFTDTKVIVYGQTSASDATLEDAQVQAGTTDGVLATIPSTEPAGSMYFVWPENSSGIGSPVAVNQTTAQWIAPLAPAPSTTVSVYGRNLDNSSGKSWVYLQPSSGTGEWAAVTDANPYRVQFTLPAGLATGASYQVWVYNGQGGLYGWSTPLNITVGSATNWSGIVNVKTFGATGNGTTDDGPAIETAIHSLTAYETLYFPAGTYRLDGEQLVFSSNVRVMGDSPTTSILRFDGSVPNYGFGPFEIGVIDFLHTTNVDFESLGITYNGPTISNVSEELIRERYATDMTFNNVNLTANSLGPIDWEGSSDVSLTNSTVIGDGSFVNGCHNVVFDNDLLLQAFDSYGQEAITFWGGQDISITNCTTENYYDYELQTNPNLPYDPTGFGEGRYLELDGLCSDIYIAGNQSIDLGEDATPADHNSGEQMASEGSFDSEAAIVSATSNTFTLPGDDSSATLGEDAIVTSGIGLGQEFSVASVAYSASSNTTVFTLNRNFTVIPTAGSNVVLSSSPSNLVFYQNTLNHTTGTYANEDTASVGFQLFTGGYGVVVDGNTVNNTRAGIRLWSAGVNTPIAFVDVINNTLTGVQDGIGLCPDVRQDPNFYGVEVRGNSISGASTSYQPAIAGLELNDFDRTGLATLSVFEHNTITGFPIGLEVMDDPDSLSYKNSFSLGSGIYNGSTGTTSSAATPSLLILGNTFSGYATANAA